MFDAELVPTELASTPLMRTWLLSGRRPLTVITAAPRRPARVTEM